MDLSPRPGEFVDRTGREFEYLDSGEWPDKHMDQEMTVVPFGPYQPDLPAHLNPGLIVCKNAVPRTKTSYGPLGGIAAYSSALTARCQGSVTVTDLSGNVYIFAGDASKLYDLTSSSTSFTDISKTGGYSTASDGGWSMCIAGARMVMTNGVDAVQTFLVGTDTKASDLSASAPTAKYCAMIKDFLFLANINDGTARPKGMRWSASGDVTSFPTVGTSAAAQVQSDDQDLYDNDGQIQGIVGGLMMADGLVFQERSVYRISYVGPDAIFSILKLEGARGTPCPKSIVTLGGLTYYVGQDASFYACNGLASNNIGAQRVAATFAADLDTAYYDRVVGAVDIRGNRIFWAYPGSGNSSGLCNKLLIYDVVLDQWGYGEIDTEYLVPAMSFGYTLDTLDTVSTSLDALAFSLDSRQWTGGAIQLGCFDSSHKLSYFGGSNLAATFETGDLDLGGLQRIYCDGVRPVSDGGTITAAIRYRNDQASSASYTGATSADADGVCHNRISARYIGAQVNIASGGTWTHAKGIEPIVQPDGTQ